jgi:hypothetical protein
VTIRERLPQFLTGNFDESRLRLLVDVLERALFKIANRLTLLENVRNAADTPVVTSATYDVLASDRFVVGSAASSNVTYDLEADPKTAREVSISREDATGNTFTIDGNGNNINGASTTTLTSQYEVKTFYFTGTEWRVK